MPPKLQTSHNSSVIWGATGFNKIKKVLKSSLVILPLELKLFESVISCAMAVFAFKLA